MSSLALLLLATPVFGFSLQAVEAQPELNLSVQSVAFQSNAAMAVGAEWEGASSSDNLVDKGDGDAARGDGASPQYSYTEQMSLRNDLAEWHRPLGIATWGAMTATVALGTIQYYNLYGVFSNLEDSPCVQGTAVFGQGQCHGTPWLHAGAAGLTTALYTATFSLAMLMPDPDNLADGPGDYAATLRMHKLLRWVHFGGMVAQAVLGFIVANPQTVGLSRSEDYGALQALSTVHLGTGLVTWGALTWAGALMTF